MLEVSLIIKVAGIGLLVAVSHQILTRAGREEQATLVSVAGVIIVLLLLVGRIGELFGHIKEIFDL